MVGDQEINAGRYSMFAALNQDSWDIIFSSDRPIWGAANRDETKDVLTVNVPTTTEDEAVEALSIIFEDQEDDSVHMIIGWIRPE